MDSFHPWSNGWSPEAANPVMRFAGAGSRDVWLGDPELSPVVLAGRHAGQNDYVTRIKLWHPTPVWSRSEVMTPCNLLPMLDVSARASVDETESCNTQPGNSMEDHEPLRWSALMIPSQTAPTCDPLWCCAYSWKLGTTRIHWFAHHYPFEMRSLIFDRMKLDRPVLTLRSCSAKSCQDGVWADWHGWSQCSRHDAGCNSRMHDLQQLEFFPALFRLALQKELEEKNVCCLKIQEIWIIWHHMYNILEYHITILGLKTKTIV